MSRCVCNFFSNEECQFTPIFFLVSKNANRDGALKKKILWERGKKGHFSEKILTEIAFAYLPKYIPRQIFSLKPIWKHFLEAWCFRRSTFWVDRTYASSLSTLLFISCYDMVLKSPRWCLGCSQTILTIWKP